MIDTPLYNRIKEFEKKMIFARRLSLLSESEKNPEEKIKEAKEFAEKSLQPIHINIIGDEKTRKTKELFFEKGEIQVDDDGIALECKIEKTDNENEALNDYMNCISLDFFVNKDGRRVGECGISSIYSDEWRVTVEILPEWRNQQIAYKALSIMFDEIKNRLGESEFYADIFPDNYPSRRVFEKLGAVPAGVREYCIYGENKEKFEEENSDLIDDKFIATAEEFNVPPKKLLSHILVYKILWE